MRETTTAPLLTWSRVFPATPEHASAARQFLAAILNGSPATDEALLCLAELAANAILHSASTRPGGTFTVRATLSGGQLRVEVTDDGGPWQPPTGHDDQSGRGLLIVDALARNWGITEHSSATTRTVWFEMPSR